MNLSCPRCGGRITVGVDWIGQEIGMGCDNVLSCGAEWDEDGQEAGEPEAPQPGQPAAGPVLIHLDPPPARTVVVPIYVDRWRA